MTPKQRWIAALKMETVDRLPFWPKINNSYINYQSGSFKNMSIEQFHNWIGSDRHQGLTFFIKEKRNTSFLEEKKQDSIRKIIYGTKYGNLTATMKFDPSSQAWHPIEFPVKNKDDIKIMAHWFSDCVLEIDREKLQEAKAQYKEIGNNAVTVHTIGTSAMMVWVQHLAGIENCHYFLADYTSLVEELFDVMNKKLLKTAQILAEQSPADFFYLVENTSTTLISPSQCQKYCFPVISECAKILANKKKLLVLHMCGYLKGLLPILSKLAVSGFEAFTSPPVGNTTLIDGRSSCPDKCLIGGTNAVLWTKSAEEIIHQIENDLEQLPHHRGIVITSAGVMPPVCKPETIKKVCQWVKEYKIKL
ncbi:MAG: hypothetical protein NC913_09125 [Candidatus Omnitrophica bacterium]|nr:hypothetical protein [Candidatus Omnitrophota bacterium]